MTEERGQSRSYELTKLIAKKKKQDNNRAG